MTQEIKPFAPSFSSRREGKFSLDTSVAIRFLEQYSSEVGMECPSGRGSTDKKPSIWLPRGTTKAEIYKMYCKRHRAMFEYALSRHFSEQDLSLVEPEIQPLSKDGFCRIWRRKCPYIRIMKAGSDFFATCTHIQNFLSVCEDEKLCADLRNDLQEHRREAHVEFQHYKKLMNEEMQCCFQGSLHLIFDFAQKVLLPSPLRKAGQLFYIAGLKFDFFGVSVSNLGRTDIHCLTEGHWPSGKTADEVFSMLHRSIEDAKNDCLQPITLLQLHADNCGGQNKNRFMLWYFLWRVIKGMEKKIVLYFMIAGHTKNRCDCAFGFVKRKLRQENVLTPDEMVSVVERSSESNKALICSDTKWRRWKEFLSLYFSVPKKFKLSKYHVFEFDGANPFQVRVRVLSNSKESETFRIVRENVRIEDIRAASSNFLDSVTFEKKIEPLDQVASANEANRRAYLEKNITERYFPGDESLSKRFFGSGDGV